MNEETAAKIKKTIAVSWLTLISVVGVAYSLVNNPKVTIGVLVALVFCLSLLWAFSVLDPGD